MNPYNTSEYHDRVKRMMDSAELPPTKGGASVVHRDSGGFKLAPETELWIAEYAAQLQALFATGEVNYQG